LTSQIGPMSVVDDPHTFNALTNPVPLSFSNVYYIGLFCKLLNITHEI